MVIYPSTFLKTLLLPEKKKEKKKKIYENKNIDENTRRAESGPILVMPNTIC